MTNNNQKNQHALSFTDKKAFRKWLEANHNIHGGIEVFIYKKGYQHLGISYEDAVRTALCFGWIDAVTHRHDKQKFRQYFAPRRKKSNWSLSNIIRMKELIDSGEMTEFGLKHFDLRLIEQIDNLISKDQEEKANPPTLPLFFTQILKEENAQELFLSETASSQRRYISYILNAKKEETKIRRCYKIIGILKGEKNNL